MALEGSLSTPVSCFICLSEEGDMCQPCKCPRHVHPHCVARWQVYNAGREEEKTCRYAELHEASNPSSVSIKSTDRTEFQFPFLSFPSSPPFICISFCKATLPDWRCVLAQGQRQSHTISQDASFDQNHTRHGDNAEDYTTPQGPTSAFMRISFNGKSHKASDTVPVYL